MTDKSEIASINTCVALLNQHHKIHRLTLCITVTMIAFMLFMSARLEVSIAIMSIIAIILGVLETVIAIRVGFDQQLLENLSGDSLSDTTIPANLEALDNALNLLKLMPSEKSGRSLPPRLLGCIRLLKKQALLSALQILSILTIAVIVITRQA